MKYDFQLHWNTEYGVRLYIQYLMAGNSRVITHIHKEKNQKELLMHVRQTLSCRWNVVTK